MAIVLGAIVSRNKRAGFVKVSVESERNEIPANERVIVDNRSPEQRRADIERHAIMYALLEPANISPFGDGEAEEFVAQFQDCED